MPMTQAQRKALAGLAESVRPESWPAVLAESGLQVSRSPAGELALGGLPAVDLGRPVPAGCGGGSRGCGPARLEILEASCQLLEAPALKSRCQKVGEALEIESLVQIPRLGARGTFHLHQECASGPEETAPCPRTWPGAFELTGRWIEIQGLLSIAPDGEITVRGLAAAADLRRSRLTLRIQGLETTAALVNSLLGLDDVKARLARELNRSLSRLAGDGTLARLLRRAVPSPA